MALDAANSQRLLQSLAEELKLPLLQIARQAELHTDQPTSDVLQDIMTTADMATRLVDGYILQNSLHEQVSLQLEPVSVSAVVEETLMQLRPHAERYNCQLNMDLAGRYGPVMADGQALKTALLLLGYSFIQLASQAEPQVVFGVRRNTHGLVAGVYSQPKLTQDIFQRGRALFGTTRQPMLGVSSSASAGVFVAQGILDAMAAPLKVSHYKTMSGLATTLLPSQQLELVPVAA